MQTSDAAPLPSQAHLAEPRFRVVPIRAAGFLSDHDVAQYRPKAQAALEWILNCVTPETLESSEPGYVKVTGRSTPDPRDFFGWHLGWTLEALCRSQDI